MLGAWKSFRDILEKQLSQETGLKKEYTAANETYTKYAEQFLLYWFETVPNRVIEDKAKRDSERYENVVAIAVLEELRVNFGEPLEAVLTEFDKNKYVPPDTNDIKLFRENLKKVKQNKYDTADIFRGLLDNWIELKGNAETKRSALLNMRPAAFRDRYAPFSYKSPAQFVDMYLVKLTCSILRRLTSQVQSEKTDALNELRKHSSKFPLEPDSKDDLTEDDFKSVRLSFDKTHSQRNFPEGTIGSGMKTNIDEVDVELKQLKEQETSIDDPGINLKKIEQVFGGLPKSGSPCYCRIKLLSERTQRSLLQKGEDPLSDYLTELRFVQGDRESERFNTRSRGDLNVCTVKYPGLQLQVEFYQYPSDTEPRMVLPFPEPWACLRMLRQYYYDQKKGFIRLNVSDKERLGGILFLQLDFFYDSDCKQPVDVNFIEAMTGS